MSKKISTIYVKNVKVLGDKIINDTAEYLVNKIVSENHIDAEMVSYGLLPEKSCIENFQVKLKCCFGYKFNLRNVAVLNSILENLIFLILFFYWRYCLKKRAEIKQFYQEITEDCDLVFFCGGGLFQQFYMNMWAGVYAIIENCKRKNIPIYFNAIGSVRPHILAERILYKYLLTQKVVKVLTIRDNYDYVKSINKGCVKVVDPALWVPECYNIKKKDSEVIGIGVVRPKIFADNKCSVSYNQVLTLYLDIISALEKKGYNWQIFCNGGEQDWEFAVKLYSILGKPYGKLVNKPESTKELIKTISGYKAVIAGRLHAVITAIALDIPAIGIVWADKFNYFQQDFKLESFIYPEDFIQPDDILAKLEHCINSKVDTENKNLLKNDTYKVLKSKMCKYLM